MIKHRFCGVFTHKKQMYLVRLANANGPNCMVWPPKPLYRGLSVEKLAEEIESGLDAYVSLGRPIYPPEWKERSDQALAFFGEKSEASFQRKKKDITIRFDSERKTYNLFDGGSGAEICEQDSVLGAARAVYERLGEPVTEPPAMMD